MAIRVFFVNNDGGGFANHIDVPEGTTVEQFFALKVGGNSSNYTIRVNRMPAAASQTLRNEDRITITPNKIAGADTIRVFFVNNDGGGFANHIDVPYGTTVEQFFALKVGGNAANYTIRVNRMPAASNQSLRNEDRITITPNKIAGAATGIYYSTQRYGTGTSVSLPDNTTIEMLIAIKLAGNARDYDVLVNGHTVDNVRHVLVNGDRVNVAAKVTAAPVYAAPAYTGRTVNVFFVNNDGGGFAQNVSVAEGTTVRSFFDMKVGGQANSYTIRVNRESAAADQVLRANDRITITPAKIAGARA